MIHAINSVINLRSALRGPFKPVSPTSKVTERKRGGQCGVKEGKRTGQNKVEELYSKPIRRPR